MNSKMLKALLLTSALIAAGCDQQTDQAQSKGADILLRAQSYFDQGQYSAASIEARNALKENSKDINAYLLLARIFHEQGNYPASVKLLLELPQDNLEVIELLGNNYVKQKKYNSLQQLVARTIVQREIPTSFQLSRLAAVSAVQQAAYQEAESILGNLAALANTPDEKAATEVIRSFLLGETGQTKEQLQALEKALAYAPTHVDALLEKARIKYMAKEYEVAEDLLSQALIALPTTDNMTLQRMEVLQAMASTLSRQNRSGEAMIYSKLIAEANPKAQEIQNEFEHGIEKLKAGNLADAEEVFSRLYLTNNARVAGSVLGMIRFQQGDYEKAMEFFESTIDPETASPEMLRAYAESQLRMRHPEKALQSIESNVNNHPNDPDLLGVYGLALLATGKTEEGVTQLIRALSIDPTRTRLKLALAAAYNNQGKGAQALQQMEEAFEISSNDVVIQERLATQYAALKQTDALKAFADKLVGLPSPDSKALGGLILFRLEPKRGAEVLDTLYAASPSEPAVLRAQLRKSIITKNNPDIVRFGKSLAAIDPNDIGALGAVLQATTNMNAARDGIQYLEEQVTKSANSWGPEYVLAVNDLRNRNFQSARKHISLAITKSGYNASATAMYGQIYLASAAFEAQAGNLGKAREIIHEAIQNNEVTTDLLHLMIKVEIADNNITEAEKLLAELEQTAPGKAVVYQARGDLAKSKQQTQSAQENYEAAWKSEPSDILATDLWSIIRNGNASDQLRFLSDWTNKLPQSVKAHTMYGIKLQESHKRDEAIEQYQKALALNPALPLVLNNLAWLLMEKGRLEEALSIIERAVGIAGEDASILDTYGWIAFKSGKQQLAIETLTKAAALQPDNTEIRKHLEIASSGK